MSSIFKYLLMWKIESTSYAPPETKDFLSGISFTPELSTQLTDMFREKAFDLAENWKFDLTVLNTFDVTSYLRGLENIQAKYANATEALLWNMHARQVHYQEAMSPSQHQA